MEHFYQNIQGWFNYQSIYDTAVTLATDGAHFVEIGAWRGKSTAYMAVSIVNSGKRIKFDTVDTWLGSLDEEAHVNDPAVLAGTLFDEFVANMQPVKDYVFPQVCTSMEALKFYEDNSLDFVFVDGSHKYEDVKLDITEWLKKVKPGGMLAGDDFEWPGVKQAVKELLPTADIIPYIGCWVTMKQRF